MSPDEPEADEPEIDEPRPGLMGVLHRHRRLLTAVAALWFAGLMIGGIFLSQLDARLGLNLFGPRVWVAGEPAVVRVALRELRFDRLQALPAARAHFERPGATSMSFPLNQRVGELVQGLVTPPPAGDWTLVVLAQVDDLELRLDVPVSVLPTALPTVVAPPPKAGPLQRPDRGSVQLDARAPNQVLAANFPGRLMIRAMEPTGVPAVGARVVLSLRQGRSGLSLPTEVVTGPHGLVELPVQTLEPLFWIDLEIPPPPPTAVPPSEAAPPSAAVPPSATPPLASITRRLTHRPTQFLLVTGAPVVAPGDALAVGLRSLHRTGPAFVDVWQGARWRASMGAELVDGEARFLLPLPADLGEDPALLWVQAYRSPYLPGTSRGGTYVLASRRPPEEAIRLFADQLAKADHDAIYTRHQATHGDADPVLARYLLGLLPVPETDPPLLTDTSESARQTVASLKSTWQRRFVIGLVGSGVLMFGFMLWLLRRNARDVQRRWAEAGGGEEGARGTRFFREGVFLFLILAVFLAALIQLVLVIRW